MVTRPSDRATRRSPGACTGPCPCHAVSSRSQASVCRVPTWPAGAPAATSSRRHTRVRTARGMPVSASTGHGCRSQRGHRGVGRAVEVVGVVTQQGCRARQRRGHARAEVALEVGQGPAGADPGEGGVLVHRVVPPGQALRPRGLPALRPGHLEEGTAEAAAGGRHPGQGPCPGTAGEAEQHLLGLVVEGVPEQHGGGAVPVGGGVEGGVAGRAGGGLEALARRGDLDGHHVDGVEAERAQARRRPPRRPAPSRAGGRGRRRPPPARHARPGASNAVAAASARESAPPLHATSTRSPAVAQVGERADRQRRVGATAAVAASGDPQRRSMRPFSRLRATHLRFCRRRAARTVRKSHEVGGPVQGSAVDAADPGLRVLDLAGQRQGVGRGPDRR